MSLAIIAPVVVKFERCDAIDVPRSNLLGKLEGVVTVLNNAGVLYLFLMVNLAKFLEESGVDALVDPGVGVANSFVVELDDMM
eukprot:3455376-Ditylum_brightwellii.AAC.1